MNPRLKKRMMARSFLGGASTASSPASMSTPRFPPSSSRSTSESSAHASSSSLLEVRNEAALLLSLSDIVNREVQQTCGGLQGLFHDDDDDDDSTADCRRLPAFPRLGLATVSKSYDDDDSDDSNEFHHHLHKKMKMETTSLGFLKPRCELLYPSSTTSTAAATTTTTNLRLRSVSIDSPRLMSSSATATRMTGRVASPISLSAIHHHATAATLATTAPHISPVTPRASPRRRRKSSGGSKTTAATAAYLVTPSSASTHRQRPVVGLATAAAGVATCSLKKGQELQGPIVLSNNNKTKGGIIIKTISRKKFSWKNYPELEAFLIDNRNDYLAHSALNYTIQQKQYNNQLTVQLLELATRHGYRFDVSEFSFVTVRDRIRCYYKSYVQSAKKRGVLMGYAAHKAGLLLLDSSTSSSSDGLPLLGKSSRSSRTAASIMITPY